MLILARARTYRRVFGYTFGRSAIEQQSALVWNTLGPDGAHDASDGIAWFHWVGSWVGVSYWRAP